MRITQQTLHDWKGIEGAYDLGRLNLLIGSNGTGKSGRLLGPQFAVTGTVPHGEKPQAAAAYAGLLGCTVTTELDDGFQWVRGVRRNIGDSRVVTAVSINGEDGDVRGSNQRIGDHVGNYAPMFNLGALLSLSPDKLREHILGLCARTGGASDPAELADQIMFQFLRNAVGMAYVPESNNLDARRGNLVAFADQLPVGIKSALLQQIIGLQGVMERCGGTLNRCIAIALKTAKDTGNAAARDEKRARMTAQRLAEEKAQANVPAGTLDELREKRSGLTKQRDDITAQIANQKGRASARRTYTEESGTARSDVAEARAQLAEVEKEDVDAIAAKAARLEDDAKTLDRSVVLPNIEAGRAAWLDAQTAVQNATLEAARRRRTLEDCDVAKARLEQEIQAGEQSPWAQASGLLDKIGATNPQWAPEAFEAWVALRELVALNADENELLQLRRRLATNGNNLTVASEALQVATATLAECTADEKTAKAAHDAALKGYRDAQETSESTRKEADRFRAEALALRNDVEAHNAEVARLRKSIQDLEALAVDRERKLNELDAEGGQVNVDDLTQQRDAIGVALADLDGRIDRKTRSTTFDTEYARAVHDAEHWATAGKVAKGLVKAIGALRDEVMRDLVAPLVKQIDEFLAIAAPGKTAYCNLESPTRLPIFELGWVSDGRPIALEALSGGESALFCVGLAASLVKLADPPLKLLLIEAGALDGENLGRVLAAIEAIAGPMGLGNAIVASHVEPVWADENDEWNVVRL